MSIRAYKLIEIKNAKEVSFNLTHDTTIYDNLIDNSTLDCDNCGIITLEKEKTKNLLQEIQDGETKVHDDEDEHETIKRLKQIIKDCGNEEYVEYYCY